MKISPAILAAVGLATIASPALATGVSYADLNLNTPQGQEILARRIDSAAKEICGIADVRTGTILQGKANERCYKDAKESARKQIAARVAKDQLASR